MTAQIIYQATPVAQQVHHLMPAPVMPKTAASLNQYFLLSIAILVIGLGVIIYVSQKEGNQNDNNNQSGSHGW
jgi:hypothetical protein